MPTYDYQCTKCLHIFELFQSITSEPVSICPKCNSIATRQISAGAGLIFKGSGFYITDYKHSNTSPSGRNSNGKKPKPSTEKKSEKTEKASSETPKADKKKDK